MDQKISYLRSVTTDFVSAIAMWHVTAPTFDKNLKLAQDAQSEGQSIAPLMLEAIYL